MHEPVLTLERVSKKYGNFTAVDNIDLRIPRGSVYGFLGPNGAGKTTTMRMILDIIRPSSGSITVLGKSSALEVRDRIGYLPEEKGLYKKMKVAGLISYFASLKGMARKTADQRAEQLLEQYGLKDFTNARIESLSKGMSQKVQVLAAVAHEPELVILDEPFSGLDPVNQQVLEELINNLSNNGQTVIFSTHIMEHAERLCDQILLIAGGKKIFDGSVVEARALVPRRVLLETTSDVSGLQQLESVAGITPTEDEPGADPRWLVEITNTAHPQDILKYCFDQNIPLNRFEFAEPSLHDVFVGLVGKEAREQRLR
ncbi:MAG: ATP-binding cassette domain-containing protein [Gammaproteobacteria bacterium]|nr:ATP-binding cassette domain-containing protein [Gammaproteobacteria bacterium]